MTMENPYILAAVFMVAVTLVAVTSMTNTTRRWKVRVADLEKQLDAMSKTINDLRKLNGEQLERIYGNEDENKRLKEELTCAKQLAETRRLALLKITDEQEATKKQLNIANEVSEERRLHVVLRNKEIKQAADDITSLQAKLDAIPSISAKITDDDKSHTLALMVATARTSVTIPVRTLAKSNTNKATLQGIADKINKHTNA